MARVAGVDIPNDKKVSYSLRSIYGVGPVLAGKIVEAANVDPDSRIRELSEGELDRLREVITKGDYVIEGDLRREGTMNVRRLIDIGSYRGLRHRRSLPVHGQRTRTNARSRRGTRRTVAGRRRAAVKK